MFLFFTARRQDDGRNSVTIFGDRQNSGVSREWKCVSAREAKEQNKSIKFKCVLKENPSQEMNKFFEKIRRRLINQSFAQKIIFERGRKKMQRMIRKLEKEFYSVLHSGL